jgi:type VI secretion system ImpB/VipA family protein
MSALEEKILTPVAPDDPAGPNLEYDPTFVALERALRGKAEQQIGTTIVPAEPPNWKEVQGEATELLGRSKDLRAACGLAVALLHNGGLPGFAQGLAVVRGLIERYWEGLHPRLDPDDDLDPTMRVNVLAGLAEAQVLAAIRTAPLVSSRAVGRFSLRDPLLEATRAGARDCLEAIGGIEASVAERIGMEHGPDLSKTAALLRKMATFLGNGLARRRPPQAAPDLAGPGQKADSVKEDSTMGAPQRFQGEIGSRDDVIRALDSICAYYARFEPSSPVPMFMERCKRLVTKNFMGSSQKFIARNRAPRVQIEYDVELYGAEKKVQLPFVMGVMSDLSGKPAEPLPAVADRKFLEIDVDNFDERMKAMKPRVAFQVPNTLTGEGNLNVDITFESMDDFSPAAVARKVDALNKLLEARTAARQPGHLHGRQDRRRGADRQGARRSGAAEVAGRGAQAARAPPLNLNGQGQVPWPRPNKNKKAAAGGVTFEASEFAALLQKEFKPKTERAQGRGRAAVRRWRNRRWPRPR